MHSCGLFKSLFINIFVSKERIGNIIRGSVFAKAVELYSNPIHESRRVGITPFLYTALSS